MCVKPCVVYSVSALFYDAVHFHTRCGLRDPHEPGAGRQGAPQERFYLRPYSILSCILLAYYLYILLHRASFHSVRAGGQPNQRISRPTQRLVHQGHRRSGWHRSAMQSRFTVENAHVDTPARLGPIAFSISTSKSFAG